MKIVAPVIFILCLASLALAQTSQIVTATGIGRDQTTALDDAKRNAIEQGVGVVLSAKTVTSNYQLLSDNIYTRANGFVKSYKVLSEMQLPTGEWQVKIEASVTGMLDQVLADQAAVDILLEVMGRPRLMFLVDEQINFNWFQPNSGLVETILMQAFMERNFVLVDRQQVAAIRNNDMARLAATGNAEALQSLGRMFKAEAIVVGQASAVRNSGSFYGMISMRADLNVKVIRVDTGELLGVAHETDVKALMTEEAAARAAFESAAQKVSQTIIGHIIRKWGGEAANYAPVYIQISNVDFLKAANFETWVKSNVSGVKRVTAKPFEGSVAEYEVAFEGSANDLAKALAINTACPVKVLSVTQNKIVLVCP